MRKKENKRKIKKAKTLGGRYIKRKYRVGPFVQVTKNRKKEEDKKRYKICEHSTAVFS